ncbi:MAG: hypothetical protein OQK24_08100 [Magnetovibrio sp.]|nr:hypothetical protein [Magnetovibrio sp.]
MVQKQTIWGMLCVVTTLFLIACDNNTSASSPSLEAKNCATIAGRATDKFSDLVVIDAKQWDAQDIRGVQLRFEYPSNDEPGETAVGFITCTYPLSLEMRTKSDRVIMVKTVMFKGRYLSEREIRFLNDSPFRPHPKFKLKD